MTVEDAIETLQSMIEDYYALDYPSISRIEVEALETIVKHLNKE